MKPMIKIALTAIIGITIVVVYRVYQQQCSKKKPRKLNRIPETPKSTTKSKKSSDEEEAKEEKKSTAKKMSLRATNSDILHPAPFDNVNGTPKPAEPPISDKQKTDKDADRISSKDNSKKDETPVTKTAESASTASTRSTTDKLIGNFSESEMKEINAQQLELTNFTYSKAHPSLITSPKKKDKSEEKSEDTRSSKERTSSTPQNSSHESLQFGIDRRAKLIDKGEMESLDVLRQKEKEQEKKLEDDKSKEIKKVETDGNNNTVITTGSVSTVETLSLQSVVPSDVSASTASNVSTTLSTATSNSVATMPNEAPSIRTAPADIKVDNKTAPNTENKKNKVSETSVSIATKNSDTAALTDSNVNSSHAANSNECMKTIYKMCRCRKNNRELPMKDAEMAKFDASARPNIVVADFLPVLFYAHKTQNLFEPSGEIKELPKSFFEPKPVKPDNYLTPALPILNATHSAHRHACLIHHLLENYDFFE